jgi:hypothetical protein
MPSTAATPLRTAPPPDRRTPAGLALVAATAWDMKASSPVEVVP